MATAADPPAERVQIHLKAAFAHLSHPDILQARSNVSAARVRGRAVCLAKVHVDPPVVAAYVQVLVPDHLVVLLRVRAVQKLPQRLPCSCPLHA